MRPHPLTARLLPRLDGAGRVAVIGIGSPLHGDDAAGVIAAQSLDLLRSRALKAGLASWPDRLAVFIGETTPENLTGPLKAAKPALVIVIDAADLAKPPGHIELLDPADTTGITFSTHGLPLHVLADYLAATAGCATMIVGIQPASCALGAPVSPAVKTAALSVGRAIAAALDHCPDK